MAFTMANRGLYALLNSATTGSTDVRAAVFTGTPPSAATIRDWNFLSDVIADGASAEATVSGYARQDLASFSITEDDTNDRVQLLAAAPTMTSVAAGETFSFIAYYIEGGSDAARTLIGIDTPSSTLITNGGNVTLPALTINVTGS